MRFLADADFPYGGVLALRAAGHDVLAITEQEGSPVDEVVLAEARRSERIVLTFDSDFGELVFHRGLPAECGIVYFRSRKLPESRVAGEVVATLAREGPWVGMFTVVEEDGRLRRRPLPSIRPRRA